MNEQAGLRESVIKTPLARRGRRAGFAAVFACLRGHFPAAKIFYDLRLDLRFVW